MDRLDEVPDDFHQWKEEDQSQFLIEKFYPGPSKLTANEVCEFASFKSLHEFQLWVAVKRCMCYKDNSEIVGVKQEELEEQYGGQT